jgi:hypothetical protein
MKVEFQLKYMCNYFSDITDLASWLFSVLN